MVVEVTVHPRKENTTIETQARHTGSIWSAIEMNSFRQRRSTEQDRTVAEKLQSR